MRTRTLVRRSCGLAVLGLVLTVLTTTGSGTGAGATPAGAQGIKAQPQVASPGGYWTVGADGGVFSFASAGFHGSTGGVPLNQPVVGIARTPSSNGYWEVAADGGVFAFGDAGYFGSMGGHPLNAPIVGMAGTPTGNGYWLVAADGGVFAFGDAGFRGSMGGVPLRQPIVGIAATPTGNGYWLVAADGGVFAFGDATFHGSLGGKPLNRPIVGITGTSTGNGYWLVAADGGVFAFGDAGYFGSMGGHPLNAPIVGIAATQTGNGYWLVAADGGVFAFGDAGYFGSMGGHPLNAPIVGIAPVGPTVGGAVLTVGNYNGHQGQFTSIQAAVNAARPGDWILVAPGDYHELTDLTAPPTAAQLADGWYGGLEISTPDLHIRGMNRNSVIVDGTKPGSSTPCSSNPALQNLGPTKPGSSSQAGQNGIVVWKADNVSIQNLTVCNYLGVAGYSGGNQIWWNGGEGSGKIGMAGYSGSYLTATDTYNGTVNGVHGFGNYGIFASTAAGPGVWNQIYANNFTDSGMYIGACQQACDGWVHNAWMENNGLGYSGTNSGGTLVVDHSQFDNNADGFDTNTQSVGDPPPPQNGACPNEGVSGITHTASCWVFMDNNVHNNNNANVPGYSTTGEPTGTGMTVAGANNDTVMNNLFANNGAWGTLVLPYPDLSPGAPGVCTGSGGTLALGACIYDPSGDAVLHNTYVNNGFFGNPSNSDIGEITFFPGEAQNCFAGNLEPQGSSPANLEQTQPTCGAKTTQTVSAGQLGQPNSLINQVLCDTGFASTFGQKCSPTGDRYPTPSAAAPVLTGVPRNLPTMPNPCLGVPRNAWCPGGRP